MIRRILGWLLVVFVLTLIVLWLIGGGGSAVARTARAFINPINFLTDGDISGAFIRLPWQIDTPIGADLSALGSSYGGDDNVQTPEEYAARYQELSARAAEAQSFGNPSAYVDRVSLYAGATNERDPAREYVEISVHGDSPVDITNWSLQSAVSGQRLFISQAASPLVLGTVNLTEPVYLAPGSSAIIVSGPSPVGVSFRENKCSGYLNELQEFTPALSNECPRATDILIETPDNLRIYGARCFDYVETVPQCHFPGVLLPASLSAPCRTFAANTLSYNGCVQGNRYAPSFQGSSWRAYLNSRVELWDNAHDIIRLLDSEGHTVDTLTY